jgi:hypothetical protein
MPAKTALPSAFHRPDGKVFAVSQTRVLPSANLITDGKEKYLCRQLYSIFAVSLNATDGKELFLNKLIKPTMHR